MKIINVYCDACGNLTPEHHTIEDMDFCPKCWPTIVETVKHLAAGMMAEEPDDPTANFHNEDTVGEILEEDMEPVEAHEEEPAEEKPKKRFIDRGKAQALRDAGWGVKDIAAEIGVSDWWVY